MSDCSHIHMKSNRQKWIFYAQILKASICIKLCVCVCVCVCRSDCAEVWEDWRNVWSGTKVCSDLHKYNNLDGKHTCTAVYQWVLVLNVVTVYSYVSQHVLWLLLLITQHFNSISLVDSESGSKFSKKLINQQNGWIVWWMWFPPSINHALSKAADNLQTIMKTITLKKIMPRAVSGLWKMIPFLKQRSQKHIRNVFYASSFSSVLLENCWLYWWYHFHAL